MQEPATSGTEPVVLHIRISGRWVPVLSALSVFALLPALTGSTPVQAGSPQHLAAPARLDVEARTLGSAAAETITVSAARLSAAAQLESGAIDFPNIALGLATTPSSPVLSPTSPFVARPGFIMPVRGPLMSLFGPRRHPVLGIMMFHTGIDLGAACATPIRAAADGTVAYAGVTPSWGQRIILQHDAHLKTGYAHMSTMFAKEGDTVKQGQVIGLVGTTGWSTGCHLHFDVILNERYVDPRPYLGLGPASSTSIPYRASPHRVTDGRGTVLYTVEDGDVPIPATTPTATSTTPSGTTTTATQSSTTTTTPATTTTTTPSSTTTTTTTTTAPPTTSSTTTTEATTTTTTTSSSDSGSATADATTTSSSTSTAAAEPTPTATQTTTTTAEAVLATADAVVSETTTAP
jgi:murein DD-endopeptidase MepM/ murein hydrolase activator NlpD